ncbi:MAG TPA: shikimate dehydrogenase [Chitinophagales bacterium]|nr:shikimate dehydrogenase [Chitinophagales bacterium]
MRMFGLIGYPLIHSFSKNYFSRKFLSEYITDAVYENFEIKEIALLKKIIAENPSLRGLNVTIPYKEAVIPFLDELDADTKKIGAVNTIKVLSGRLKGFNTDYVGFLRSLIPLLQPHHKKALILGTGGSSKAVKYALEKIGIDYTFVSRNPSGKNEIPYAGITKKIMYDHTVIVNTTPVGMFPEISKSPAISYQWLTSRHLLYDLIYNPEETLFLKKGKQKGAVIKNGCEMLELQAEEAWKLWSEF